MIQFNQKRSIILLIAGFMLAFYCLAAVCSVGQAQVQPDLNKDVIKAKQLKIKDKKTMAPGAPPASRSYGTPHIIESIKKPWTDYVIDSLVVERDNQGNIKVMVKAKNLGDNDKSPLWVAVGINRPGADWIEIGAIGGWYVLADKARLGSAVEIKAMADSKKNIREINEDNNFCSVYLAPAATRGQSNCY